MGHGVLSGEYRLTSLIRRTVKLWSVFGDLDVFVPTFPVLLGEPGVRTLVAMLIAVWTLEVIVPGGVP